LDVSGEWEQQKKVLEVSWFGEVEVMEVGGLWDSSDAGSDDWKIQQKIEEVLASLSAYQTADSKEDSFRVRFCTAIKSIYNFRRV
jgi:hypothetical protein